jgi:ubiquinone/menaquinone biosynthesis C-methylase UbiE
MREDVFKRRLIERAGIQPGQAVLDLGCGTGTLTLMIKRSVPGAHFTGVDGDPAILSIARQKAAKEHLQVQWEEGMAYALPYLNQSFDVVVSSLVIHHLVSADKLRAFREVRRVLRHGGRFHILDFGPQFNALTRLQVALMHRLEHVNDNFRARIVPMLREAGFASASQELLQNTVFGPIWLYGASS